MRRLLTPLVICLALPAHAQEPAPLEGAPDAPREGAAEPPGGDAPVPLDEEVLEPEVPGEPEADEDKAPDTVIRQKRRGMFETAGSVSLIEEALLETTEYDDPHAVLGQVPGVYARTEDGYGLRPNIGIRGVTSERSQKVTLMEDGVLFGPAPYSAPAAYYFPLMTRMVGLEVLKGPAAILYGPNTIGGAVNLVTRAIPRALAGGLDLALGSAADFDNVNAKGHGHLGTSWGWGGVLGEVVHLQSTGFKQLDAEGDERPDTGFGRTEAMVKAAAYTDPYAVCGHRVELKLGFAREVSRETYLGLSDEDFAADPWRRYGASALDRMSWDRYQLQVGHTFFTGATEVVSTAYTHHFARAWRKLNRFRAGPSLEDILANPESATNSVFHRILGGLDDSLEAAESLMIGTNDRRFEVYGAQSVLRHRFVTGDWKHRSELGLRLHHDAIRRLHTEDAYAMTAGRLVFEGEPRVTTLDVDASATALAAWLAHGVSGAGWIFTPGVRMEWIQTDYGEGISKIETSDAVLLPGLGVHRELARDLGVFAGVYRGFSPVGPGQPDEVEPETSLNWELGLRWLDVETGSLAEVVGFWNDYDNLVGTCTMSSGCNADDLDRQFNGGAVTVLGVEAALAHRFGIGGGFVVPVRLAYTLTHGVFDGDFESDNPQFGRVEAGDRLPYVPTHQLQVQVGLEHAAGHVNVAFTFVDAMREEASQGDEGRLTDASHSLDVMAGLELGRGVELYARGENLLMEEVIGSRRPFGARPGKPVGAQLGVKWRFGE